MRHNFEKVCVLGLGYIGLPTAALIASRGVAVVGVDVDASIVETVAGGRIHITEADLDGLVQKGVLSGSLKARQVPEPADAFLIAVPTPLSRNKKPVVDHVFSAVNSLAPHLDRGNLIILESTCPVGTTEDVCDLLARRRPDLKFPNGNGAAPEVNVAYCPERVLPGRILAELEQNDRCIGGATEACAARARQFYEMFVRGRCFETQARTAEMVKLTENAFRDTNIAFANELSLICDRLSVNVWDVIAFANRHPRVNILNPGPGVGGHCIAVDPWFLVDAAPREARLIRTAREVNDGKADYVYRRAREMIEAHPDHRVLCLGITFKANVGDLRESPALAVTQRLAEAYGEKISVIDPCVDDLPDTLTKHGVQKLDVAEAFDAPAILLLLVDHDAFRTLGAAGRDQAVVYDTRGMWRA